ncbi:unnamed protein product [Linum trigynum]|uniref:Uncharacterized protein n=1 Tax=Linum trigynum TaxID=586398 RepID=A0AAV2G2R4_9ROSI
MMFNWLPFFPGVDPKGAINSECNEVVQFLTHSHREDVTYRAMTVYRVFLMQGLGGFKTEVRASDKQLISGSVAQTTRGAATELIVPQNGLLDAAAAGVGDPTVAQNVPLDAAVAGG